jgi:hypothetical protein
MTLNSSNLSSRSFDFSLYTGWFFLMLLGYWGFREVHLDDMYITLRYARNLAMGLGFAFNTGETYYGFTSALHLLAMAAVYFFCPVSELLPRICVFAGCSNLWLLAVLVYFAAKDSGKPEWGVLGGTLLLLGEHLYATIGLDPIWCVTLAMAGLVAEYRGRHWLAALFLGLATLARPDAAIIATLVFGRNLLLTRRLNWTAILVYGCVVLTWHGFAWIHFGSPLPQTLGAKMHQGRYEVLVAREWTYWWFYPIDFFPLQKAALLLPIGLFSLVRYRWDHPFALLGLWSILHTALYFHVLKVPPDYTWYYVLPSVAAILWLAIGIASVLKLVLSLFHRAATSLESRFATLSSTSWKALLRNGGFVAAGFALLLAWVEIESSYREGRPEFCYWSGGPELKEAGIWIRENTPEDIAVLAQDIGAVGYYSERYIYDFCELVHDSAHRLREYEGYEFFRMYPNQGLEFLVEEKEGSPMEVEKFTYASNPPAVFIKRFPSDSSDETPQTASAR